MFGPFHFIYIFINRALKAGSKSPGLVVYTSEKQRESKRYKEAIMVTLLGAMEAVYVVSLWSII